MYYLLQVIDKPFRGQPARRCAGTLVGIVGASQAIYLGGKGAEPAGFPLWQNGAEITRDRRNMIGEKKRIYRSAGNNGRCFPWLPAFVIAVFVPGDAKTKLTMSIGYALLVLTFLFGMVILVEIIRGGIDLSGAL